MDSTLAVHRPALPAARPPHAPAADLTLALLRNPYHCIGDTAAALHSEVFQARLALQPTLFLTGVRAATLFYDERVFQRRGAAPEPLRATLFGNGAVQGLDGARHRHRKALFTALAAPPRVAELTTHVQKMWQAALPHWQRAGALPLYRALQPILTRAVCDWAGVPVPAQDLWRRNAQLVALFDSAASGVVAHLRSRWARWCLEAWLARLVIEQRAGRGVLADGSAAKAAALYRDADGTLLPPRVAAVELLNLLRPVVAVSLYMTFVAHALHTQPRASARVREEASPAAALAFAQEVRRHYPFFPALAARVREDAEWHGLRLRRGQRALLDLFGTNHDRRVWPDPWRFDPERFIGRRPPSPFELVPQGGGDAATQHRCPGEDVALQLMMLTLRMLLHEKGLRWQVAPGQSDRLLMQRLPAIPEGGFAIGVTGLRGNGR